MITIVGARPQILKAAAISREIKTNFSEQIEELIVHTGQHYDKNMSAIFFEELGIPTPFCNLNVGSLSHTEQTAEIMLGIEKIINENNPDAILIYGDTNSTVAAALTASKMQIPIVHVEAGLRSFNKIMPEEINRIFSDHVSTLLFCPTETAIENLKNEGFSLSENKKATIDNPNVILSGDIMYDNSLFFAEKSNQKSDILKKLNCEENEFILVTIHRNTNTDDNYRITQIIEALLEIATNYPYKLIIPLHPRTKKMLIQFLSDEIFLALNKHENISLIEPIGFLDMIALESNSKLVITDSGGVQKEAYFFKKPCVILRSETEWIELVKNGNAILADASKEKIISAFNSLLSKTDFSYPSFFGDGKASTLIVEKILSSI